jgi:hypothetical protein
MEELDPRQQKFKILYLDPNSETFSNAKQSALKAGFAPEYADNILSLMPKWLSEIIATPRRIRMLDTSERNLEKALDIPIEDKDIGQRALDATKFVASRLGKDIYSERSELTGKDGKDLPTPILGNYALQDNNSNTKDNPVEEKD